MNKTDKVIGWIGVGIVSVSFAVMAYFVVFGQIGWWL